MAANQFDLGNNKRYNSPKVVVLEKGNNPVNQEEYLRLIMFWAKARGCEYFAHIDFNREVRGNSGNSELEKWLEGKAELAEAAVKIEVVSVNRSPQGTPTTPPKLEKKSEDSSSFSTPGGAACRTPPSKSTYDRSDDGWAVSGVMGANGFPSFAAPNAKDPDWPSKIEGKDRQQLRWQMWTVIVSSLPHHQYLVRAGVQGDIHGILSRVGRLGVGQDAVQARRDLGAMLGLKKVGTSWGKFSVEVIKLRQSMRQTAARSPRLMVGEGLLVECVLHAVQQDPQYATTVELLRQQARDSGLPLSYDTMMETFGERHGVLGTSSKQSLTANLARAKGPGGAPPGSGRVCHQWVARGSCSFGSRCRFVHDQAMKATRKGKCPHCGDAGHGLQDCPKWKGPVRPPAPAGLHADVGDEMETTEGDGGSEVVVGSMAVLQEAVWGGRP